MKQTRKRDTDWQASFDGSYVAATGKPIPANVTPRDQQLLACLDENVDSEIIKIIIATSASVGATR